MNLTSHHKGYGRHINSLIILGEIIILNIVFTIQFLLFDEYLDEQILDKVRILYFILNTAYLPTLMFNYQKFQENRINMAHQLISNAFRVSFSHLVFFLALLSLLKVTDLSRYFLLTFSSVYFFCLVSWWLLFWMLLKKYRQSGYNFKNVIAVGSTTDIINIYRELTAEDNYGYRFLGFFSNNPLYDGDKLLPILGDEHDAIEYMQLHHVDELYCCHIDSHLAARLMHFCENNLVRFFFMPSISPILTNHMQLEVIGTTPVLTTRREPMSGIVSRISKRIFDLSFASFALLLSPLWFFPIAFLVKLSSPGPILFKQLRTGRDGKDFWCYKFRSMRVNVDCDRVQATRHDPRKTRVGNFLRRSNLDELPQFINIFRGDMSVVGPRPHMLKHTEDYSHAIDKYMVRHYVKPGLTGWAQVNGYRGETKEDWQMQKRVEFDIWYLENWSFGLDMKIIFQTIYNMVKKDENAF